MQYRPTVIKVIDKIFTISLTLTQRGRFVTTHQSTSQGAACSTILQRKKNALATIIIWGLCGLD